MLHANTHVGVSAYLHTRHEIDAYRYDPVHILDAILDIADAGRAGQTPDA
jgi:hypothetical protein